MKTSSGHLLYVGMTADIEHRLNSHLSGNSTTTSKMGHLKLRHIWEAPDFISASKLKRYLLKKTDKDIAFFVLKHQNWNPTIESILMKIPTTEYEERLGQAS